MKKFTTILAALLLISNSITPQQSKVVDRIIELGRSENMTMHHLDVISNRSGTREIRN